MISTGVVCRDFIGRTIELEFLIDRVGRLRAGRGGLLVIKGNAGIGKSRLTRELLEVTGRDGIRTVETACAEFGDTPFAPVISLADALDLRTIADRLRLPADGVTTPGDERSRRFAACAAAFAETAAHAPFVAVVEDIHWATPTSLDLLRHIGTRLRESPALIVVTVRDDEAGLDSTVIRGLDLIERDADAVLGLRSLTSDEIKALIASVLRDDGRRISAVNRDEISELSDGHPFHAEELLRGLLERKTAPQSPVETTVPRSLRTAVVDRLDVLDERERLALAHSAVIGPRFEIGLLATLLGMPQSELLPILRKARNAQLIVEEDDGKTFSFRHALTREVVYAEILRAEARDLHARIAREMIERSADAIVIAYHAWRSGDDELTYTWNVRCGNEAADLCAHAEAIRHYERAVRACPNAAERSILAERLAQAHFAIGEIAEALSWLDTAIAEGGDDTERTHRLALDKARVLFEAGEFEAGIDLAASIVAALERVDRPVRFEAETRLAALLNASGRSREAYVHLKAAEGLTSKPDPRWSARHQGILAHTLHGLGRIEESTATFIEAARVSREIGDLDLLERTLNNHAGLLAACGDTHGAIATYREALTVARTLQSPRLIAWVQQNLAYIYTLTGEFDAARTACREATGIDHGVAMVSRWLAATELRIEALTATPSNERIFDALRAFEGAERGGDGLSSLVTAGAIILARQAAGDAGNDIAERYLATAAPADEPWIGEAAARLRADLMIAIRARIEAAAAPAFALGPQATLALLDARIALRERRRADADALAKIAVDLFKTLGWPVEEAYARELRGGVKEALAIFRRIGAHAEVARLTSIDERAPRKRGEGTLTVREREIANLIAAGKTNREVAEALVISERTVETHVASIYGKFGVSNRKDLIATIRPTS